MTLAVIDTNVIVSAQVTRHDDTATRRIVKAIFDGVVTPVVSVGIFAEYEEVLSRPKFMISRDVVAAILGFFNANGIHANPVRYSKAMTDEKDRVFFETALAARAMGEARLVTGNARHYPDEPFVVSPARFCEIAGI